MENPFDKLNPPLVEGLALTALKQLANIENVPARRALPEIAEAENPVEPSHLPTSHDLRRKAQQCRADAEGFTIPELREHLLEIAGEYERLAVRGEQFEARSRLPNPNQMNAIALAHWYA